MSDKFHTFTVDNQPVAFIRKSSVHAISHYKPFGGDQAGCTIHIGNSGINITGITAEEAYNELFEKSTDSPDDASWRGAVEIDTSINDDVSDITNGEHTIRFTDNGVELTYEEVEAECPGLVEAAYKALEVVKKRRESTSCNTALNVPSALQH